MRRDDVQDALDAMAAEARPPTGGIDTVLARGRRRRVQRRAGLVGFAAVLLATAATASAILHANRHDRVVSLRPTATSAPPAGPTTPAPLVAPPIVSVSALETWIFTNPPRYTNDGGDTWHGVDLTFRRQTAPTVQAPLTAAIAGGNAWVLSAGAKPDLAVLARIQNGGAHVETIAFPRLTAGTTVVALTFADENHGWALTATTGSFPTAVDLYATRDGGITWSVVNHRPPIAAAPADSLTRMRFTSPNDGWAIPSGSADALERTSDGGASWRAVRVPILAGYPGLPASSISRVFANGDAVVVFGGRPTGMQYQPYFNVSTDGGNTWSEPRFLAGIHLGTFPSTQVAIVDSLHWRILAGPLWSTDDGGRTWQQRPRLQSLGRGTLQAVSMAFSTPDDGWVSGTTYPAGSAFVRHTTDGGRTWTDESLAPVPAPPVAAPVPAIPIPIAVAAPSEAWLCTDPVLTSANGGRTWSNISTPSHPPVAPNYQRPLCSSVPGGDAWVLSATADPDRVQVTHIEHGGPMQQTYPFPSMRSGDRIIEMTFADATHGWAINAPGQGDQAGVDLYATTDGARTWSVVAHHPPAGIGFSSATDGWAAGSLNHVEHTTDGGRTWHAVQVPTPPYDHDLGFFVTPIVTRDAIVANGSVPSGSLTHPFFDVSTDGGRTWDMRAGPARQLFGTTEPGAFAALDADHWQLASANILWTTSDAGRTWRKVAQFVGVQDIVSIGFLKPFIGFVSGVGAHPVESASVVLQTNDAGTSWHIAAASAPPVSNPVISPTPGGGIEGCPTQPLTPPPAGNPPAGLVSAALDYLHTVRKTTGSVLHVYRVGEIPPYSYGSEFSFAVRSCGADVANQSWVVEMIGPPNGGPGASTLEADVALAHYADGWRVFGRYH